MNDSLLAQSYAETYDISYPEAINRIAEEVAKVRRTLGDVGRLDLPGIGTLTVNEDGKYAFEPCEAGILTPELYGLGGIEMLPVQRMDMPDEEQDDACALGTPSVVALGTAEAGETGKAKSAEVITIRKSLLRNIAAACIALVAFFALSTPLDTPNLQKSQIDTELLTRIMPKEITNVKDTCPLVLAANPNGGDEGAGKEVEKANEGASKAKETAVQENGKTDGDTDYYSIVLASRVTKSNAATYAKLLQSKGFKATKVVVTDSNVKVVYGTFGTEEQAKAELNRLRGNEAFADGWITKVNG